MGVSSNVGARQLHSCGNRPPVPLGQAQTIGESDLRPKIAAGKRHMLQWSDRLDDAIRTPRDVEEMPQIQPEEIHQVVEDVELAVIARCNFQQTNLAISACCH